MVVLDITKLLNSEKSKPSENEIKYDRLKKNTQLIIDIIQRKISKNLISKNELKNNYKDILNGEEIDIRNFLQKIYISNIDDEPELSSLLYHLLEKIKFKESKFYIIKTLPRCHDELSFLICLRFSMIDNYKLKKDLPLYDNDNIFEEFINPHFSYMVINILEKLKEEHDINFLGFNQTSMFEYLSFSYLNGELIINDDFLSLFFDFYIHFEDDNRHVLTTSPLISNFKLSKKSFNFYFKKLKDILNETKGNFPKWNDNRKNNELFYSYNNCIREIKNILSHIENVPGQFEEIEQIYQVLLDGEYFPEENHDSLTLEGVKKYIERGRKKQKKMYEGKIKKYKNPFLKYSPFKSDLDLFKPSINRISFLRRIDEGLNFSEQTKEYITDIENTIREEFDLPKKGEQWKSETELYYMISKFLDRKNIKIMFHYRPEFLQGLELDIYFETEDKKVGIEYQGLQHFKPIEFFGGEESFKKVVERDKRKMDLCRKNNVQLIYYNYNEEITLDIVKKKFVKNNIQLN